MSNVVTTLQAGITPTALYGQVETLAPFIVALAVFAFGYGVFKRVTKGASKGKLKI